MVNQCVRRLGWGLVAASLGFGMIACGGKAGLKIEPCTLMDFERREQNPGKEVLQEGALWEGREIEAGCGDQLIDFKMSALEVAGFNLNQLDLKHFPHGQGGALLINQEGFVPFVVEGLDEYTLGVRVLGSEEIKYLEKGKHWNYDS